MKAQDLSSTTYEGSEATKCGERYIRLAADGCWVWLSAPAGLTNIGSQHAKKHWIGSLTRMPQEIVSGGLARHVVLVEGRPENVDDSFYSPTRWLFVI